MLISIQLSDFKFLIQLSEEAIGTYLEAFNKLVPKGLLWSHKFLGISYSPFTTPPSFIIRIASHCDTDEVLLTKLVTGLRGLEPSFTFMVNKELKDVTMVSTSEVVVSFGSKIGAKTWCKDLVSL